MSTSAPSVAPALSGTRQDQVAHRSLRVREVNPEGSVCVILEGGLGASLEGWDWVQSLAPEQLNVIAYDRPGLAGSAKQPGRLPASLDAQAMTLVELVRRQAKGRPVVLAAHSYGGLIVQRALLGGLDVRGVVFVDSTHPEQISRSPKQERGMPWMEQGLKGKMWSSRFRKDTSTDARESWAGLGHEAFDAVVQWNRDPEFNRAVYRDFRIWKQELASGLSWLLPPAPAPVGRAVVLCAQESELNDPHHGTLQRELTAWGLEGEMRMVSHAGHFGIIAKKECAQQVVAAIAECAVVDAATQEGK